MHDPLVIVAAWPGDILLARRERRADGVHAGHERAVFAQPVGHGAAHASHDAHVHRYVGGIGNFHAHLRDRRADRAHRERDHVHRAPAHAAIEQPVERGAHLARLDPVVGRAGVFLLLAADEGALFHAGDVARMRAREEAIRPQLRIQTDEGARGNQLFAQPVVFRLRPVTPDNAVGLRQARDLRHPLAQRAVTHPGRCIRLINGGNWCVHR